MSREGLREFYRLRGGRAPTEPEHRTSRLSPVRGPVTSAELRAAVDEMARNDPEYRAFIHP